MTEHKSPQHFPSEFPIKVMGRQGSDVRELSQAIVEKRAGPLTKNISRRAPSVDGNFLALTYTITATSREQLDDIYRELTACKSVLMAL